MKKKIDVKVSVNLYTGLVYTVCLIFISKMLDNPTSKAWLLRKLGLEDEDEAGKEQLLSDEGGPLKEPPDVRTAGLERPRRIG